MELVCPAKGRTRECSTEPCFVIKTTIPSLNKHSKSRKHSVRFLQFFTILFLRHSCCKLPGTTMLFLLLYDCPTLVRLQGPLYRVTERQYLENVSVFHSLPNRNKLQWKAINFLLIGVIMRHVSTDISFKATRPEIEVIAQAYPELTSYKGLIRNTHVRVLPSTMAGKVILYSLDTCYFQNISSCRTRDPWVRQNTMEMVPMLVTISSSNTSRGFSLQSTCFNSKTQWKWCRC